MSIRLKTEEAAAYLGLSPWTLIKWRANGKGPALIRLGSRIQYRREDLDSYLADQRSEPGA